MESILHIIPGIVSLTFLVAAFVFALIHQCDNRRAKSFVVIGLGILLFQQLVNYTFSMLVVRILSPSQIPWVWSLFHLVVTTLHLAAISFLIAAAFQGRRLGTSWERDEPRVRLPSDDNPYSP